MHSVVHHPQALALEAATLKGSPSIAPLLERYLSVKREITRSFPRKIEEAFGCDSLALDYQAGVDRPHDEMVVLEVLARIAELPPSKRLSILETAAGPTLGHHEFRGGPIVSRAVALAFPDKVDVTVSDYCNGAACFYFDDSGRLAQQWCWESGLPLSKVRVLPGNRCRIELLSGDDFRELEAERPGLWARMEETFTRYGERSYQAERGIFIRPILDPELEHQWFGVRAVSGIDHKSLSEHFPEGRFDVVFARFVDPGSGFGDRSLRPRISESMRGVLAHGGYAVASIDFFDGIAAVEIGERTSELR